MRLLTGFHRHHILPRHAGGSDDPDNLVLLHPIDHAIYHLVRYRMVGDYRDLCAAKLLFNNQGLFASIHAQPYRRPDHAAKMRGRMKGARNPMWGKPAWNKGLDKSDARVLKNNTNTAYKGQPGNKHGRGNLGKKQDPEWRERRLSQIRGRTYQLTCPHCGQTGGRMMLRWHFANCRQLRTD